MSQTNIIWLRCFLCRRKSTRDTSYRSSASICPGSKKTVKEVVEYLARSNETEMHFSRQECICNKCYANIVDYDAHLVKVLRKQRYLKKLVEKAAEGIESEYEDECNVHMSEMNEFNDDHYYDDVMASEHEISQAMNDAMGRKREQLRMPARNMGESRITHHQRISPPERRQLREREPLPCNMCTMEFNSKHRLQKHIVQAHKKYNCELCNFSHRNEDYVMLHMNLHEGRTENQCRFCEKEFTTKISTIRHMEVHFDLKKYQCDKCGLCFSQTTVLYNHKLQHEAEEQPLRCEICNQIFKTKRTYRHHMITHRADRPRYSCEYCGKTFTEKYTLKVHKRTHSSAEVTQSLSAITHQDQQIAIVGEVTVQTQPTPVVAATVPTDAKFSCIICDQPFVTKDNLNKHMEKEHDVILKSLTLTNFSQYEVVTNEPKKPCHICGHMFSTQSNLDYHLEHVHGVSFK